MDVLGKCLTIAHLRRALLSLPETLDDTYERILKTIAKDKLYREDAFRIFQWLVFSTRPLLPEEVAEIVAVNTAESRFDPGYRLEDPRDLLIICSSLITTVTVKRHDLYGGFIPHETVEIRLAHFSVQECLTSDRISIGPRFQYDIKSMAQEEITTAYLIYLLSFQNGVLIVENFDTFPLARYAAQYWYYHSRLVPDPHQITTHIMRLLIASAFNNSLLFHYPDTPLQTSFFWERDQFPSALHYACREGLYETVELLLERGASTEDSNNCFICGSPLSTAASQGHTQIVALLLAKGAAVNSEKFEFWLRALQMAA